MADLNPIGSEKLQGDDKIRRILEIARYNETTQNLNENKSDYTIQLADGNVYSIVHEKSGYIVKKGINESELDYINPMKNRKYYRSYSQAMKKINLIAGELNRIHEHNENVDLIGEQKKFVLKTPEPEVEPSPEASMSDMGGDLDLGGGEEELDLDMDLETPENDVESEEDEISFKMIQKLTGKLGQKLRTLDNQDGMSSEDIKYVLNSIISAVNLESLSEEDLEDVLSNFEDEEIDYGTEGDIDIESGDDEMDFDLDMEEEPVADEELDEGNPIDGVLDEVFTESKIEKVLSNYFDITESEKKEAEDKNVKRFILEKVQNSKVKSEIKELSETVEQQLSSEFIIKENKNTKFLGKTNKDNLVFEVEGKQLKISPTGEIL